MVEEQLSSNPIFRVCSTFLLLLNRKSKVELLRTCAEECNHLKQGKLLFVNVHLGHGFNVLLDFANSGSDLSDPLSRQFFLLDRCLQMTDNGAQNVGQIHGSRALGQSQDKEVRPCVSHQGHLSFITAKKYSKVKHSAIVMQVLCMVTVRQW